MRDKVEAPPEWAAQNKRSARALIAAELATLRGLRAAVKRAVGDLLLNLSDSGAPEADKLRALWAVRQATANISAGVEAEVLAGRKRAREAATKRLAGELVLLRSQLASLGHTDPPDDPPASDGAEDDAFAKASADSFAAAWGATATASVLAWADDPTGSIATGFRQSVKLTDHRLRRTATTEVSRAYSDEHDEGIGWVAEQSSEASWLGGLFKRWEAMLDRRVCATCAAHDGEVALAGANFNGGDEPGEVHANCRCIDTMIFIPLRISGQKTPGRYEQDDDQAA